jgi:hypothetical protein
MECLDCGEDTQPEGEVIMLEDIMDDHVDVDTSIEQWVQLECGDCGAVLGYTGAGAAIGSSTIRGYY